MIRCLRIVKLKDQFFFSAFSLTFLWAFAVLLFSSCGNGSEQAGTATEGESYISGYVYFHASSNTVASFTINAQSSPSVLLKGNGFQGGFDSTIVSLVNTEYGQSGLQNRILDSVQVAEDGFFEIPLPEAGVYSLIAKGKGSVGVRTSVVVAGKAVEIDSIGMSRTVTISGTIAGVPDSCQNSLTLSTVSGEMAAFNPADSTFSLDSVPGGYSALFLGCGKQLQQWDFVIPGYCDSATVLNLSFGGAEQQVGSSQSPISGEPISVPATQEPITEVQAPIPNVEEGYSIRVLEPIILRQSCVVDFNS